MALDVSRAYPRPLLFVTTFVGPPRRFDLPLHPGLWAEALRFETLKTRSGARHERTAVAAVAVTFDLWRTADLAGWLRQRIGGGWETVSGHDGGDWTVAAVVEGEAAHRLAEPFVLLPGPRPVRLPFPFDVGLAVEAGGLRWARAREALEVEVVRATLLLDVARHLGPLRRAALGPEVAYAVAVARGGGVLAAGRGPAGFAEGRLRLERVVAAVDDRPVTLGLLLDARHGAGPARFDAAAVLRLGLGQGRWRGGARCHLDPGLITFESLERATRTHRLSWIRTRGE